MIRERLPGDPVDAGFTLVEMLVAVILSAIVGSILLTLMFSAQHSVQSTTAQDNLNAEARVALNRISRDMRQATPYTYTDTSTTPSTVTVTPAIIAVQNADGVAHVPGAVTSVTFNADYNGDGCIAGVASDPLPGSPSGTSCKPAKTVDSTNPETVTYCWGGTAKPEIYLISGTVNAGTCNSTSSGGTGQPFLSGQITNFELYYRSNLYRYDKNGDGITTWNELVPFGGDYSAPDRAELASISSVVLVMTATTGTHTQAYQTQIDLRNVT